MLVAVTGAGGFLGNYVLEALRRRDHAVRGLVRRPERLAHIQSKLQECQIGELREDRVQAALVEGAEAVIHLALDWRAANDGPLPNMEANMIPALHLLEAAHRAHVRQFLFISSLDVYARCASTTTLAENHATCPTSHYGAFKPALEQHLLAYHRDTRMNTSAWRPATMYGLHFEPSRSIWAKQIETAARGSVDTQTAAHVVYLQDVALSFAIGDESVAGQIYNLVDSYVSLEQVAEALIKANRSSPRLAVTTLAAPQQRFDNRKAVNYFEQHGQPKSLRRGLEGVREYACELLAALEASGDSRT